jgi:hypothetical protein
VCVSAARVSANVGVRSPTPHPSQPVAPRLLGSCRNFNMHAMACLLHTPPPRTAVESVFSVCASRIGHQRRVMRCRHDQDYPPLSYIDYAKRFTVMRGIESNHRRPLMNRAHGRIEKASFMRGAHGPSWQTHIINIRELVDGDRHSARHAHRYHSTTRAPPCPEHSNGGRRCFQKRLGPLGETCSDSSCAVAALASTSTAKSHADSGALE